MLSSQDAKAVAIKIVSGSDYYTPHGSAYPVLIADEERDDPNVRVLVKQMTKGQGKRVPRRTK